MLHELELLDDPRFEGPDNEQTGFEITKTIQRTIQVLVDGKLKPLEFHFRVAHFVSDGVIGRVLFDIVEVDGGLFEDYLEPEQQSFLKALAQEKFDQKLFENVDEINEELFK